MAVLGSGVGAVYPPERRGLASRRRSRGALWTDYPLGTKRDAGSFPPRTGTVRRNGLRRMRPISP
jgi:predicted Rossmann fold nucleotide-binding protein DprA/Smf involved in DNA uptake